MFESIVNDYLQSTPYKEWLIIVILQYTASKSELSRDTIDILKTDSYSVLWSLCKRCNTQVYAKNKANKILSNHDKSFSSDDVKHFIDEVQLKNERKEFNIAVCQNVTSANTLQTLKEHCVAKIEIEDIRNVDVNEVTVSTGNTIKLILHYVLKCDLVERVQEEVDIFSAQRIESELGQLLESLETKSHLENYNIICLFNVEFSYMKQLFKKLPMDQMCMIKNKWSEAEEFISKKEIEEC
ncbi:16656_t:CDS:2 [Entrophospora sp. SA101]|nr:16656_t:CDS:2 [Entrophospora sp. SA101]